jgi:large subunit ribosomal protein L15
VVQVAVWGRLLVKDTKAKKLVKVVELLQGLKVVKCLFIEDYQKEAFKNPFRKEYNPINLDTLNGFDEGTKVTPEVLAKAGLLKKPKNPVKLLGRGTLEKAMNVALHKFSESAKEAVVKAGGTVEEI